MFEELKKINDVVYIENEPMKKHTSFEIGGPADLFAVPQTEEAFIELIREMDSKSIPFLVLGKGSNLLIRDGGIRGVVVSTEKLKGIERDGDRITAKAGNSLREISDAAIDAELSGFEFASGIPGTLGGGVRMNAGAYDGEMKDVVESVRLLDPEGNVVELESPDLHFAYRHSLLQEKPYYLLSATLRLTPGEKDEIRAKVEDLDERRSSKQPLEYPSAGSTFRRPKGYFAGKLIQDAGMQGKKVGGAQVSEKHAGFVINAGGATAKDVLDLIHEVQKQIKDQFGVDIETEVIPIGEE